MTGIEQIIQEREEQLTIHQRTVHSDLMNNRNYQLSLAAATLALPDTDLCQMDWKMHMPEGWHPKIWQRMWNKPHIERLRIAGALAAAEIDRLTIIMNAAKAGAEAEKNFLK